MKYGFSIPNHGPIAEPDSMVAIARRGEGLGYDSLLFGDHIVVPRGIASRYPYTEDGEYPGSDTGEAIEQVTSLAFLAAHTRRLRLVTSVIIVPYRNPLLAAKALATVDVLSKGRLVVGIGVGWMREEFETLGVPPFEERGAVTDEYVRAFKELWTSDNPTFQGKYCRFSNIIFLPKPVQKPHPPIWVGGESPRAIRRAAESSDGWYPLDSNPDSPMGEPEQLADSLKRLRSYARKAGRDPNEIEIIYRTNDYELEGDGKVRTSSGAGRRVFTGSPDDIASDIRKYQEMGVSHLVVNHFRRTGDLEEILKNMEDMAKLVWPLV